MSREMPIVGFEGGPPHLVPVRPAGLPLRREIEPRQGLLAALHRTPEDLVAGVRIDLDHAHPAPVAGRRIVEPRCEICIDLPLTGNEELGPAKGLGVVEEKTMARRADVHHGHVPGREVPVVDKTPGARQSVDNEEKSTVALETDLLQESRQSRRHPENGRDLFRAPFDLVRLPPVTHRARDGSDGAVLADEERGRGCGHAGGRADPVADPRGAPRCLHHSVEIGDRRQAEVFLLIGSEPVSGQFVEIHHRFRSGLPL